MPVGEFIAQIMDITSIGSPRPETIIATVSDALAPIRVRKYETNTIVAIMPTISARNIANPVLARSGSCGYIIF